MASKSPSLQITEEDIVHACKVLDALKEAFDRVASKPSLAPQLAMELAKNSGDIFDALLAVTTPDLRIVVYDLGKSALNMVKVCLQSKQSKKKPSP